MADRRSMHHHQVECTPDDRTGGIPSQHLCRLHQLLRVKEEMRWIQMGWDLESVQIERCEKTSVMRMAQVMVGGLRWTHVDWVHSSRQGALLLCAFYGQFWCISVVDSRDMGR